MNDNGNDATAASLRPAISANGTIVAFESLATNLVGGDTNGVPDVFTRGTRDIAPSFSLSASPTSQRVAPGDTATYAIAIAASGGFADPVTLSVAGLPAGASASFDPNPATTSSTLSVTTAATTPVGDYPLTVTGTGGGLTRTTTVSLSVTALASLSVDDVAVTEGAAPTPIKNKRKTTESTVSAVFTVSLSAPWDKEVSVAYATADDSAKAPGDYTATSGTLSFPAGVVSKTVTVSVTGDALDEDDERFFLKLSNPTNAAVGKGQGVGTIVDDDPLPALSINDVSVTEGDAGTTANVLFTVKMSAPSAKPVSVAYGTAVAPDDYSAITGATLSFAPGETTKSIALFLNGDNLREANETFFVDLTNPLNASLADGQGLGTIVNND